MTTVDFRDEFGNEGSISKVYEVNSTKGTGGKIDNSKITPWDPNDKISAVESEMIAKLKKEGCTILTVKSEFISKRRYKRRLAKENKRRKMMTIV